MSMCSGGFPDHSKVVVGTCVTMDLPIFVPVDLPIFVPTRVRPRLSAQWTLASDPIRPATPDLQLLFFSRGSAVLREGHKIPRA